MLKILAAVAALVFPTAVLAQTPDPEPVVVMILGTYHFGNPGQDVHNARIDSVLTPEKEAQLEAVAEGLARSVPPPWRSSGSRPTRRPCWITAIRTSRPPIC